LNKWPAPLPRHPHVTNHFPQMDLRAMMPIIEIDKEGYPVNSGFSFLSGVQADAEKATKNRPLQIGKTVVPPFDPFHDHLTTLILKDPQVMWHVNRLNALQEISQTPLGYMCKNMAKSFIKDFCGENQLRQMSARSSWIISDEEASKLRDVLTHPTPYVCPYPDTQVLGYDRFGTPKKDS